MLLQISVRFALLSLVDFFQCTFIAGLLLERISQLVSDFLQASRKLNLDFTSQKDTIKLLKP
jgi:hypothetical protein